MTKLLLNEKAISLRKKGLSIKVIANKLHVSTSTASRWCKNVQLTLDQIRRLQQNYRNPFYGKRGKYLNYVKKKTVNKIKKLKEKGIKEIGRLTFREYFITGVALYWSEGFKKDRRLGFANSDPSMIKFFLTWLIKVCGVTKEDIRLRVGLNISHKHRINEVEKHWSNLTEVQLSQFQKPFFQKFIWKKEFPNPEEYFGVLRIRANKQLSLFRKIHGWIEGLRKNTF